MIVESGAGLVCDPDKSSALAGLLDVSGIKERLLKLDFIKGQLNAQGYYSGWCSARTY
ncbi:hypothetical protein EMIT0P258_80154 [Pseudomonas sp. IT-P258]